jgi:Ca2+-binding RTX toxin-like protein
MSYDETIRLSVGTNGSADALNGQSPDPLNLSSGDDVIYGFNKNDSIVGQGGDDSLFGMDGDDSIDGGSGADLIVVVPAMMLCLAEREMTLSSLTPRQASIPLPISSPALITSSCRRRTRSPILSAVPAATTLGADSTRWAKVAGTSCTTVPQATSTTTRTVDPYA